MEIVIRITKNDFLKNKALVLEKILELYCLTESESKIENIEQIASSDNKKQTEHSLIKQDSIKQEAIKETKEESQETILYAEEDIRAEIAKTAKSLEGGKAKIKALLQSYHANSFPDLEPKYYEKFMSELKELK